MPEKDKKRALLESRMDLSRDIQWFFPSEAIRKVAGLATLCQVDPSRDRGKPPPNRHQLEILGRLVRALFADGDTENIPEKYGQLSSRDQQYLAHLIGQSFAELQRRQDKSPTIPLGLPNDILGTWSNLLGRSWIEMPPEARYVVQ
ncbi:MAG: hypothetical protein ACPGO3_00220 [Magnetospiraceae bacterium]